MRKLSLRTVLLLFVVGIAIASLLAMASSHWIVGRRLAALRASGEPLTFEDLCGAPIPDEENAAVALAALDQELTATAAELAMIERVADWIPCPLEAQSVVLATHPDLIAKLDQMSRLTHSRHAPPPAGTPNSNWALSAPIGLFRDACRIRAVQGRIDLAQGNADAALDGCMSILRIGRHAGGTPFQINYLVQVAIQAFALADANVAQRCLRPTQAKVDELDLLLKAELAGESDLYLRSMKGERVYGLSLLEETAVPWYQAPLKPFYVAAFLGAADKWVEAAASPLGGDSLPKSPFPRKQPLLTSATSLGYSLMPRSISDALQPTDISTVRAQHVARLRCFRVLLAMHRRMNDLGNRDDLEVEDLGLGAEEVRDPFIGSPLKIKNSPRGPIIYSVGSNGEDDGGAVEDGLMDVGFGP